MLEVFEEPYGCRKHESQYQFVVVGDSNLFADRVNYKVVDDIEFVVADSDKHVIFDDNTQRYGGVIDTALRVLAIRNSDYYQLPSVFFFTARSLIVIVDVGKEAFWYFKSR